MAETIANLEKSGGSSSSSNKFGTRVNISSYTSNFYVFPSDGYLELQADDSSGAFTAYIYGSNATNTANPSFYHSAMAGTFTHNSLFVRKGMKVIVQITNTSRQHAWFTPFA